MALNPFTRSVSEPVAEPEGPPCGAGTVRPGPRARRPGGSMAVAARPGPVWLLAHPTMEEVADRVVERCLSGSARDRQEAHTGCRDVEFKQIIKWGKFNDGFPNIFIDEVKNMAGKDVLMLVSFHSPEVIFEQLSVIYAIPRYLARSFTLILPYFPTATMERVDTEGQVATAKTLATMLSSMPLTARGPAQIVVFDIHALQERFYFSECVIPRLESAIPLLLRELQQLPREEKLAIAYPDEGAYKRFNNMFDGVPQIICFKRRDGNKRIVKIKEGDPTDCHVVIVDDLVQTGGTLIESAKALVSGGAKRVSAYATHPVFPKDSWRRFTDCDVTFDTFWITDSIPHARDIAKHPPFKLLSIADVIADVLLGYDLQQ